MLALALVLAVAASGQDEPAEVLVERILAVVDERPLLLSSVRTLEVVRGLERGRALEAAIDERLMFHEAARLPQAEFTEGEEDEALRSLIDTRPELEARVSMSELRRLVRRQLAIIKYVEFRFRPQIRITEEALLEAWNEGFGGEPDPPSEEAEAELRARLERHELDRRIEGWVRDLRGRAKVRYVEGPGSPSPVARDEPAAP